MINIPKVKVGIVAVSRDCFPESLSVKRREALVAAYEKKYGKENIYECPVCIVESEIHMQQALAGVQGAGCNALAVYLGNFGLEISKTMLAKEFSEKVGGAVAFGHFGKELYEEFKYIGVPVEEIGYNQPANVRYKTENPFAK